MLMKSEKPKAPVNSPAFTRVYAWFSAIGVEDIALLQDLLAHGVPIDVFHPLRHTTALMEATRLGRTTIVEWLLDHSAAPAFLCGMPAGTPLHSALCRRKLHIARLLLSRMETAAVMDAYGRTPLHILCMESANKDQMEQLLELAELL